MAQGVPGTDPRHRGELRRAGEAMRGIMASGAFVDALEQAATDARGLAELKANPRAYVEGKGRSIPDEASVEFVEGPPWSILLSFALRDGVRYTCEVRTAQKEPTSEPLNRTRLGQMTRQMHEDLTSDTLLDAVEQASSNPRVLAEFKADPRAHLESRGLRIPDEIEVDVTEGSICVRKCWTDGYIGRFQLKFCITICL